MIAVALFWISFAVTIGAVVLAVAVVRLAQGGILSSLVWWLLLGVLIFAMHHIVELSLQGETWHVISETLEKATTIAFLVGALTLALTLRYLARPTSGSE